MTVALIIILVVIGLAVLYAIVAYNGMVSGRNRWMRPGAASTCS
jgi:hypothetical protein